MKAIAAALVAAGFGSIAFTRPTADSTTDVAYGFLSGLCLGSEGAPSASDSASYKHLLLSRVESQLNRAVAMALDRLRAAGRLRQEPRRTDDLVPERILRHLHLPTELHTPRPGRAPPLLGACSFGQNPNIAAFNSYG